jgi:ABC-type bacteriocin/lantibiotic exporter with double-glycine peptidase domain
MEEVRSSLEQVGLLDEILLHPGGLNRRLRVGGAPLSTSQRISLLVARALVQQPRLLLIDELFDGLDEATFRHLTRLVLGKQQAWTVVVATRMHEVIEFCDQAIELAPVTASVTRSSVLREPALA